MKKHIALGISKLCRNNEFATHNINNIYINMERGNIDFVIQKGMNITTVSITLEHAQDIGFINVDKLEMYCK